MLSPFQNFSENLPIMTCLSSLHNLPFTISLNFPYKLNKKKNMLFNLGYNINNNLKTILVFLLIGGEEKYNGMNHFKVQNPLLEASMYDLKTSQVIMRTTG